MGSIQGRVAIVGMGCTRFGEHWSKNHDDLLVEATHEAFEDAGIDRNQIEAAWYATLYTAITGNSLAYALKLRTMPVTRIENACASGLDALRNACYSVAAGIYDVVLVAGVEKLKDSGQAGLTIIPPPRTAGTGRDVTRTAPSLFALLATSYFAKYGLSAEEGKRMLAHVSMKSHENGYLNPKAHFRRRVTIDEVMKAPIVAWPLGLYDCCGVSDGAAAAIVTRADMAHKFRGDPIFIEALQIRVGNQAGYLRTDYDWTTVPETYEAGKAAYAEAGVTNPREEISMAEVHDCFSITEAITMEDLQFSPRGKVIEDIESGFFDRDGGLPVQPSGGLKCFGHPIGASGLRMVYEMYKQLQGKCGERQIKNPKRGLVHNLGGTPAGPTIGVGIFAKQ